MHISNDVNSIYKYLKQIDKDCLSVTNKKDVSDEDYFLNGIYLDLVSNLLAVYINDNTCGVGSLGINLNCRLILESIYIIKMYERKKINSLNFELYRDSYVMIEYGNESKFYRDAELLNFIKLENNSHKRNEFLEKWSKKLNMERKQLKSKSKDPSFFLLCKDKPNFLVKKYLGKTFYTYYKFLGMLLHPCIFDDETYTQFSKIRTLMITEIYKFGLQFLNERKPFKNNAMTSFEDDSNNQITSGRTKYAKLCSNLLSTLNHKTTHYKTGCDSFAYRTIGELICLWRDVELCRAYGFNEQSIIKFKIFLEYMSVFVKINNADTESDFKNLVKAYMTSSIAQCIEFSDIKTFPNIDSRIEELYQKFYKINHPEITKENFIAGIKENSLFFINGCSDSKSYRGLVEEALNIYYKDGSIKHEEIFDFYNISLDASHSSGYLFNSCNYVWIQCSRELSFEMISFFKMYFKMCKDKYSKEYLKNEKYPEEEMNLFDLIYKAAKYEFENPIEYVNIYPEQI